MGTHFDEHIFLKGVKLNHQPGKFHEMKLLCNGTSEPVPWRFLKPGLTVLGRPENQLRERSLKSHYLQGF